MRKYYLDNIRRVTVVLVVIYHVLYMYNGEGIPGGFGKITNLPVQYYDLYMYIVYPWFMMILFIVSGVCSRIYLENHSEREFIKSRTTKLLVPSTVGLFAFQFLQGYVSMSLGGAFETMSGMPAFIIGMIVILSGIGVLWYIQMLWLFSVLLIPLRRLERDRLWKLGSRTNVPVLILMTVLVWASGQVLNTPVIVVYRFGLYALSFLTGYFIFSHEAVIGRLKRVCVPVIMAAAVLGTAFCIVYFGRNFADAPVNRSPLFLGYGWIACLAVLGGMSKYADFENDLTRRMGKRSFGLYVFHYLCISSVALFIAKKGILPAGIIYLLSFTAAFAGSYALNAVISRLPFFRWAVLGITTIKDDKNVS